MESGSEEAKGDSCPLMLGLGSLHAPLSMWLTIDHVWSWPHPDQGAFLFPGAPPLCRPCSTLRPKVRLLFGARAEVISRTLSPMGLSRCHGGAGMPWSLAGVCYLECDGLFTRNSQSLALLTCLPPLPLPPGLWTSVVWRQDPA